MGERVRAMTVAGMSSVPAVVTAVTSGGQRNCENTYVVHRCHIVLVLFIYIYIHFFESLTIADNSALMTVSCVISFSAGK